MLLILITLNVFLKVQKSNLL